MKTRYKKKDSKYPSGKPTVEFSVSFIEFKLKQLEDKYEKYSRDYAHYVSQGVGLTNIHVLDTLRTLTFLYTDIAAHRDALSSIKCSI